MFDRDDLSGSLRPKDCRTAATVLEYHIFAEVEFREVLDCRERIPRPDFTSLRINQTVCILANMVGIGNGGALCNGFRKRLKVTIAAFEQLKLTDDRGSHSTTLSQLQSQRNSPCV